MALLVKGLSTNAEDIRDAGLIPGSGRSPGGEHGNPLQYCYVENPMDREASWAKSRTRLSNLAGSFFKRKCN